MSAQFLPDAPLAVRLAWVSATLPPIGKDAKSPEGYHYRGIEQIMAELGRLLAKAEVIIYPRLRTYEVVDVTSMKNPGWTDVRAIFDWTITCPTGETLEATTGGIGRDKSDKGLNKAQTQAWKYLLLAVFGIADGDDVEAHDTTRGSKADSDDDDEDEPGPDPAVLERVRVALERLSDKAIGDYARELTKAESKKALANALIKDLGLLEDLEGFIVGRDAANDPDTRPFTQGD